MDSKDKKFFKCSICGGNQFKRIYGMALYSYKQTVSVCKTCGIVCLNPRWDEERYTEYYQQDEYYGKYHARVVVDEEDDNTKPDPRAVKILSDLQPLLKKDAKIMEVGCGRGRNLAMFKRNGFNNLLGLDPSPDCCRKLQKSGIVCVNKFLTSYMLDSNPFKEFDCVILSHMLEHFVEPEKALDMISHLLKPTGFLYILVPNFYGFSKPYSQFTTPHTFYFSRITLEMLLNNTSFTVDRYFENSGDEICLVAKKSSRKLSLATGNNAEYKQVLSWLKKDKVEYAKRTIRDIMERIVGKLIMITLREDTYIAIRDRLLKLRVLK